MKRGNWLVGEANPCDAVEITRLINLAYRVEDFFKAVDRTTVEEVRRYLEEEAFLAVRDESGDLLACVRLGLRPPEGHFGMLSVHPDVQGQGIGRLLVSEAEERARRSGCTRMTLEVASPRTELPAYYARLGYVIAGRAPWPASALHQLKQPAHFIVMTKALGPTPAEDHDG
ncbi:GNAT family N-acetyltransferase [Tepidiforma sp.]|uniref:GNAT family N-acetyltransferase n=1 Tax=Tepidiforma sp. TaxID=2682230 RepID=UPI002ADE0C02|nr:GNAT family N-acetyltransferase [Tepidiforma sp.]